MYVDVALVRNVQSIGRQFTITAKNISQLADYLASVDYDGGTQLGAIASIDGARVDLALLFSDGISTFGSDEPQPLYVPLYAFSSDVEANGARLRHMACRNRGRYFNLLYSSDTEVIAGVSRRVCSLASATVKSGHVSDMLPAASQPIDGHVTFVGRLDGPRAEVTVQYGLGGDGDPRRTFTIDRATPSMANCCGGSGGKRSWRNYCSPPRTTKSRSSPWAASTAWLPLSRR